METGNNLSAPLVKKEYHLQPDHERELTDSGLLGYVDISRNGVRLLKLNSKFKAVEFCSFKFPYSKDNQRWATFVRDVLESEEYQSLNSCSSISYSVFDNRCTLVPTSLFSKDFGKTSLEFLCGELQSETLYDQELESVESVGVYSVPDGISELVGKNIDNSFFHWVNALNGQGTQGHIFSCEDQFALIIKKDSKLLFCNWFQAKSEDDKLYFLMATLESLNILHADLSLVLWGDIIKNKATHSTLGKFISNISFGIFPKSLTFAYSFKELPAHNHPMIFSFACA